MSEFLSDEWITALGAVGEPAGVVFDHGLVVEPVVRGVPGRAEVRYRLLLDDAGCSVTNLTADADPADVYLETDYATAVALARGDTNAQAALADGRLRVSGDVARLALHAAALPRLADLFAAVRSTTTYPSVDGRS